MERWSSIASRSARRPQGATPVEFRPQGGYGGTASSGPTTASHPNIQSKTHQHRVPDHPIRHFHPNPHLRDLGKRRFPTDELPEKIVAKAIVEHLELCG